MLAGWRRCWPVPRCWSSRGEREDAARSLEEALIAGAPARGGDHALQRVLRDLEDWARLAELIAAEAPHAPPTVAAALYAELASCTSTGWAARSRRGRAARGAAARRRMTSRCAAGWSRSSWSGRAAGGCGAAGGRRREHASPRRLPPSCERVRSCPRCRRARAGAALVRRAHALVSAGARSPGPHRAALPPRRCEGGPAAPGAARGRVDFARLASTRRHVRRLGELAERRETPARRRRVRRLAAQNPQDEWPSAARGAAGEGGSSWRLRRARHARGVAASFGAAVGRLVSCRACSRRAGGRGCRRVAAVARGADGTQPLPLRRARRALPGEGRSGAARGAAAGSPCSAFRPGLDSASPRTTKRRGSRRLGPADEALTPWPMPATCCSPRTSRGGRGS